MSPCPSKSPLKLNIVSIMADNLMAKWVGAPILPIKVSIKGTAHKNGDRNVRVNETLQPDIGSGFRHCKFEVV